MFGIDSWIGVVIFIIVALFVLFILALVVFILLVRFGMKRVKSFDTDFPSRNIKRKP